MTDADDPRAPRSWLTVRTGSALTFVGGTLLTVVLSCVTERGVLIGPPLVVAYLAMLVFVASWFDRSTMTLGARTRALAGILATCGVALLVLLREMGDPDAARLICGLPVAMAAVLFADAWCHDIGWTRESSNRWILLAVPVWLDKAVEMLGIAVPRRADGWFMVIWALAVLFWPSRRLPPPQPRYGFRSSVLGTWRENSDLGLMMNVPPPDVWRLWIGEIVLGTGERWINPTIHRTFTPAAPIRLYAVVASRSHVVEATVEIADASDGVMHTTHMNLDMRTLEILPPSNDPRTGRPAPAPVRRKPAPPPPTLWGGAIDMMLPLSRLEAGRYTVSIRVTSGENVASATVDFSVALGLGLALGA